MCEDAGGGHRCRQCLWTGRLRLGLTLACTPVARVGHAPQIIDRQVWTQLAQNMATCYKNGNLLLRAAGGGGGGLWAGSQQGSVTDDDLDDDASGPVEAMAYGGGWGFSFTFAAPTGSGTGPGPVVGSELGHVATNCHSQCAFQTATGQFYTCFCPCLKQGFTKVRSRVACSPACSRAYSRATVQPRA